MRTLPPPMLKQIRRYLDGTDLASGRDLQRWIEAIDRVIAPRRGQAMRKKARAATKADKRAETAAIRDVVFARAEHHCEVPLDAGRCLMRAVALDHFFGGSERKPMESAETCWALCFLHNEHKTQNSPSGLYWLERFIEHCQRQLNRLEAEGGDEFFRWAAVIIGAEDRLPKRKAKAAFAQPGEQTR
jgi:hypothetical protein